MSFHLSPRRLTAAAALGVAAVLACAGPASAATPADAATWLSTDATAGGALTDGNHIVIGGFDYTGTAADAVSALVAAGGHDDAVARIDAYLKANVDGYADPTGSGGFGPSSGGLGKVAIAAEATGQDPHDYGGIDLLTPISKSECTAGQTTANCKKAGQYANIYSSVSQSLAIIALQRSPLAADHLTTTSPSVQWLLGERCTDGLFTGAIPAAGAAQCTTGSVDETGYAVQALAAVSGVDDPVVTSTLAVLATKQDASGGFGGASGVNTNSTAQALSAFSVQPVTYADAITRGRAFIENLQRADGAYLGTAADRTLTTDEQDDIAKGATPQALLAVLGRNLAGIVVAVPPTTPPTTTAPTTGTPAPATASAPELAATGVASGHLTTELLLAAVALVGGGALVRVGARRLPTARHRG